MSRIRFWLGVLLLAGLAITVTTAQITNPIQLPVSIARGGTGQTTATAAFNALDPLTTQGDVLYHNGTDSVRLAKGTGLQLFRMNSGATAPEWASGVAQAEFYFVGGDSGGYNPLDSTSYYLTINIGPLTGDPSTSAATDGNAAFLAHARVAMTIKAVFVTNFCIGAGSSETFTADVRINNTSNSQIISGLKCDVAFPTPNNFANTSANVALAAGDFIQVKVDTPAWATNPTGVIHLVQIYATVPQ